MQPYARNITHLELVKLCISKAGGLRALCNSIGIARSLITRLRKGETKRLQDKSVQKLWGYLYGE